LEILCTSGVRDDNHVPPDNVSFHGWHAEEFFTTRPVGAIATTIATAIIAALFADAVGSTRDYANTLGANRSSATIVIVLALFAVIDGAIAAQPRFSAGAVEANLTFIALAT